MKQRVNRSSGQRDALLVLAAQVLLLFASIVAQSLLAWRLLPEGRGLYALFAVMATLLPVLFTFGLDRSLQYQHMSGRLGRHEAVRLLLKVWAAAATCAGLGAVALAGRGTLPSLSAAPWLWFVGLLLIGATSLHALLLRMQVAAEQFRGYFAATLAQSLVNILLLLLLVVVGRLGPALALAALAASYAVSAGVSLRHLCVPHDGDPRGVPVVVAPGVLWRYGLSYYPALLGHAVDFNVGIIVLAGLARNHEVGIFAAISALMLKLLLLGQAFQEAMLPRIAADEGGRSRLVTQLARIAVSVTLVAGLLFALVSRPVVYLLLSPQFADGAQLVWWMLPGVAIHAGSTLLMPFFEGTGRPAIISTAVWTGLLVNVGAIIVAFPGMGLASAGLAMSLGMLARFLMLAGPYCRITGASPASLFGLRRDDLQVLVDLSRRIRPVRS